MFINYKRCLTNFSNSILKHFELETYHESLEELDKVLDENNSKNVIVILYDGMGARIIDHVLGENNFFNQNKLCEIDSVFPPTTTAATTTVKTGLHPCEHGWIGLYLYIKEINKTVSLFSNKEKETEELIKDYNVSEKFLPFKSIVERINETDNKAYFVSPFGEYKYNSLFDMKELIKDICKEDGKKYIYAYYEEPDSMLHKYGMDSDEVKIKMNEIETITKTLCDEITDSTVIVISDHGHTNVNRIDLKANKRMYDTLKRAGAIGSRCTTFFVKKELENVFLDEFNAKYKDDFLLFTKEEVLENNFFGFGNYNIHFKDALGDYLAVANTDKYFDDKLKPSSYKSHHAGITEQEIKVPVIVIKR